MHIKIILMGTESLLTVVDKDANKHTYIYSSKSDLLAKLAQLFQQAEDDK